MPSVSRHQLIAGPYRPPGVRRGDRTTCLYRDCDVTITTWTDARISWPRCRAGSGGAGAGLLVTDELVRAIRTESAAAIKYWWGVGDVAVWNWRRAFGATRINNEGSHRLIRQSAKLGAAAIKDHEFTPAEREQRRRINKKRKLYRNLRLGYHGPWWTKKELTLLGKMPDAELAKRIGKTTNAVRIQRTRMGIATAVDRRCRRQTS